MRKLLFFLIFFGLLHFLAAETYYVDSPEVADLRYLYRRAGRAFPIGSYPVHGSDLLEAAEKLASRVRAADAGELEALIEKLAALDREEIFLRGSLAAAYQHRLRSSALLLGDEGLPEPGDFGRAFLSLDPFLELAAGGGTFRGIFIDAKADFRQAWTNDYSPVNNFVLPADRVNITFDLFSKGTLFWNGTWLDASLGRDTMHFGETPGGSLYPSRMIPCMDGLRLYVPLGPFRMDYYLATIPAKRARSGAPDVDPNEGSGGKEYFGFLEDAYPSTIVTALHRFQWNFGPVKAGLGATVVYARSGNMYLATDILPVSSWHNADIRPNNLNLVLDASWAALPGLTLSGTLGFDDISADIFGIPDSATPTIPAWILQAEYGARGESLRADFLLEAGWTHYLWGNFAFRSNDTWGDVPLARAIYRYAPNNSAVLLPLTSPYGPGALWGRLVSTLGLPQRGLSFSADLLVLGKTEGVNLVTTPYDRNDDLNDAARILWISLDLPVQYTWQFMELKFSPALIIRNRKAAFECTLGARFKLGGTTFL
jgi:hypothetical protein